MSGASGNPPSRTVLILTEIRAGYGVEDIAHSHKVPVAAVRAIVAVLRKGGFLPGDCRANECPPVEAPACPSKRARVEIAEPTREDDSNLLDALRLRVKRNPIASIAHRFGVKGDTLRHRMKRVLEADLAQSGEPRDAVLRHYWQGAE